MAKAFFGPRAWAPLAEALEAYFQGNLGATLVVHADEGEADPMPVSLFFRTEEDLRAADREAIRLTRGRVLDVGAGVGAVALVLQDRGIDVTAVEVIPEAVEIMLERGVEDVRQGWIQELALEPVFDTVLLLMNGVALAGTLTGLPEFLRAVRRVLAPGGQVLVDSTDLLHGDEAGSGDYPGEIQYQLEFEGQRGAPFPQLFVDPATLARVADGVGMDFRLAWTGGEGEYLAVLTIPTIADLEAAQIR
jgi:SAM-dependent methyltransferase